MELLLLMFISVAVWQLFKRVCLIMEHLGIEDPVFTDARKRKEKRAAKKVAKEAKRAIRNSMK